MAVIYSNKDRISLKIGELVFKISPLSLHHKMEIESEILKGDVQSIMQGSIKAVKYSLKDVSGLKNSKGQNYQLKFEEDGVADSCLDELYNIQETEQLTLACLNLLKSIPDEFTNPHTGEKLEGVEIIKEAAKRGKKSKAGS